MIMEKFAREIMETCPALPKKTGKEIICAEEY